MHGLLQIISQFLMQEKYLSLACLALFSPSPQNLPTHPGFAQALPKHHCCLKQCWQTSNSQNDHQTS